MEQYTIDSFTTGWFRAKRRPGKETSKEIVKEKFEKGELYTAIILKNGDYYCFVQHSNDFFYVGFLDNLQREYLKYQFNNSEEGTQFFLKEAQYWQYERDTDKKVKTEIFQFTEQGDVSIHKVDIPTRQSEVLTSKEPIDVSMLYEDFPEFGEYEGLIRKERVENLELEI